jgi:hypothetical protein
MRTKYLFLEKKAIQVLPKLLSEYLDLPTEEIKISHKQKHEVFSLDLLIKIEEKSFAAEVRMRSDSSAIHQAIRQLHEFCELNHDLTPLLIVPYMGKTGGEICKNENIPWIDLSGNAHIALSGLRIHVEGKPNKYLKSGRPENPFSPKSARVARWLLAHHGKAFTQREIASATELYEGYTSRIVRKLESDELISRNNDNKIFVANPTLILEAWREASKFSKNNVIKGHMPVKSGEEALSIIASAAHEHDLHYAATGLAGAWQIDKFSNFRLCSVYIEKLPEDAFFDDISFRKTDKGANVWFVLPRDEGVFQCEREIEKINCVHPVQVYVDLKDHPERSIEAADSLLKTLFKANK